MSEAKELFDTYMELLGELTPACTVLMKEIKRKLLDKFKEKGITLTEKVGDDELLSSEVLIVLNLLMETIQTNLYLDVVYNELLNDLLSHEL